jgi:adenosylcobyric acid synthase
VDIAAHVRRGARVIGLCGGYQMLGRTLSDPDGVEGQPGTVAGLELLDVNTIISGEKQLAEVSGETVTDDVALHGYEMHMGVTTGPATATPLVRLADGRVDGAISADGRVAGTYVHGLFADDRQCAAWIARLGGAPTGVNYKASVEETLDSLAAHLEAHIDIDCLLTLAR